MAARSSGEYVRSLRDDRTVYYRGEEVEDVTTHEVLSTSVAHAATEYEFQFEDPDTFLDDSGRSRYFAPPADEASLRRRRDLVRESTRRSDGVFNCIRAIGTDAIHGLLAAAPSVDAARGTEYADRVRAFLEEVRERDAGVVVAMTDAKGDRSRLPSEQSNPDAYVRVVDRTDEGVVIRGTKAHTSHAPVSNELVVLPSRSMTDADSDYAVACAVPSDADGLRFVCRPTWEDRSTLESPITSRRDELETLTVFDDVFVPHERVFLDGETEFAAEVVTGFATFHRFTAIAYKPELVDLFVGLAELLAESHGLAGDRRIRRLVTEMIEYVETARGLATAAAATPVDRNGIAVPNPTYCNVGKHRFADAYHEMVKHLQDVAGGLAATLPSAADLTHPDHGDLVERAVSGADGWSGRDRYKLFALANDLAVGEFGGWQEVLSLHGEGSLATQELAMYGLYDRAAAKRRVTDLLDIDAE